MEKSLEYLTKFLDAEGRYAALQARLNDAAHWRTVSLDDVESVRLALDAALPGLGGAFRGRALLLKALCAHVRIRLSSLDLSFGLGGGGVPIAQEALGWLEQARPLLARHEPELVAGVDQVATSLRQLAEP